MPHNSADLRVEATGPVPPGRIREMGELSKCLKSHVSEVVHLHGIPGIGKSTLLDAFGERAKAEGYTLLRIDCRSTEPTSQGFLSELGRLIGTRSRTLSKICERLKGVSKRTLMVLDSYEHFFLLDAWLRHDFTRQLPSNVTLLIASRLKPNAGWYSIEKSISVKTLPIGPLDEASSLQLLKESGVDEVSAKRVAPFIQGHPLALQLTVAALRERPGLRFESMAIQGVIEELTRMFLADVSSPTTRQILVGVSVLRRITIPLLEAMFPGTPAQETYEELAALPFTEATREGLMLHTAVRDVLARSLRARDPLTCKAYRRKAWMCLCKDSAAAANAELWRYTADLLYLLDNQVWREAFFPTGESWLHVEPAGSKDNKRIREIILKHLDEESATELIDLLDKIPSAFSVVRGEHLECLGFYVAFDPSEIDLNLIKNDSSTASWLEHLKADPLAEGKRAFFIRRWLSDEHGESPSEIQAACWLDIKRTYMEMRPQLQRVYLTLDNPAPYKAVAAELGFTMPPNLQVKGRGRTRNGAVLKFGPGSVDGWLSSLLAAETGTVTDSPILDIAAQELITGEQRTRLTRLEFKVLAYLMDRPGNAVSRASLLNDVWGLSYEGGSNVVDTVVAALRKKLGDYSQWIKTISGTGYSYRPPSS